MGPAVEGAKNHLRPIKHLRWYIGGLLFLSTDIDRQTLSVLAPGVVNPI